MSAKAFDFSAGNFSSTPLSIAGISGPSSNSTTSNGGALREAWIFPIWSTPSSGVNVTLPPPLAFEKAGPTTALNASSKLPG